MSTRLFVYGTLKRGYSRAGCLQGQAFLGNAETVPGYRLYDNGSYPAMTLSESSSVVTGELWEVNAGCLAELDQIEGVPTLYQRTIVKLSTHPGELVESYLYCQSLDGWCDIGSRWPAESSEETL